MTSGDQGMSPVRLIPAKASGLRWVALSVLGPQCPKTAEVEAAGRRGSLCKCLNRLFPHLGSWGDTDLRRISPQMTRHRKLLKCKSAAGTKQLHYVLPHGLCHLAGPIHT